MSFHYSPFTAVVVTSSTGSALVRVRTHEVLDNCRELHQLLSSCSYHHIVVVTERSDDEWFYDSKRKPLTSMRY